jgi:hypothetical protein
LSFQGGQPLSYWHCFYFDNFCICSVAGKVRQGIWIIWYRADDCTRQASPANQYAIFSLTSRGTIQLRNDFGPDYDDMVYCILDARRTGQLRISLRQLLIADEQIALDKVMLKAKAGVAFGHRVAPTEVCLCGMG